MCLEPEDATAEEGGGGTFPIVGIGASAGGLSAFESFFAGMPIDAEPGMAFVLVQHLSPDFDSILTDLIQRYTRMRVQEVVDGIRVQPNHAYIIPPNRDMALDGERLRLTEPVATRGHRNPIDFFFRTLAKERGDRALCVVLSGTGSDGAAGAQAVKSQGGMVMVQSPESCNYAAMPKNTIAATSVDFILPPVAMPKQLLAYVENRFTGRHPSPPPALPGPPVLTDVYRLLREQTEHDFSDYKPSTVQRRIERRMACLQISTVADYVLHLQRVPEERQALFQDLLIGVTRFFRDPAAFAALEKLAIEPIFSAKPAGEAVRVWIPGCSTGEEAYSIAILMYEQQTKRDQRHKVQIFASDVDSRAIAAARAGVFPARIAGDLSPERLARFFESRPAEPSYQIKKCIRDMLIFSEHDLIKDPPFSKVDLISCRNLLIYLNAELQRRIIPLFHYALRPGGYLFLGNSESVGDLTGRFPVVDRKEKVFQRVGDGHTYQQVSRERSSRPEAPRIPTPLSSRGRTPMSPKLPFKELTEQAILQELAPAGALVDEHGDILYLQGRTGMYLEPAPGEVRTSNILKMAREGMRGDLGEALRHAAAGKSTVQVAGVRVKTNGSFTMVDITIRPVTSRYEGSTGMPLFLVLFRPASSAAPHPDQALPTDEARAAAGPEVPGEDPRITSLRMELREKESHLRDLNEELETSNEELRAANEELQSMNEELQSTNEELETSKEELQSVNEEMATLNTELQSKVAELTRANNDMNNLLAGTGIATVFVDLKLRIYRFTPTATQIINLIANDIGRPIGHIVLNLQAYDTIAQDAQTVLDTLIPKESEVQTRAGAWYTMRILPYRTLNNAIEGVVITFVDITEAKKARAELTAHGLKVKQESGME